MKDWIINFILLSIVGIAGLILLVAVLLFVPPVTDTVMCLTAGSRYYKAGEAVLTMEGKKQTLAVYKAAKKPFLVVGPCLFREEEEYKDFFFVNPRQLIRTATDKGSDVWMRVFRWLYLLDDLSDCECVRAPYWDELKAKGASVRQERSAATGVYVFRFKLNGDRTPAMLTVPSEFFTPDMANAPNRTRIP